MRWLLHLVPLLAAFWLLLSGHYTPLLLALGGVSILLVVWIIRRMDLLDAATYRLRFPVRFPLYAGWLAGQIALSSLAVLRQVWSPRLSPDPAVGLTPTTELSEVGTVVYANSITLTPGTLSLDVHEAGVEVHALRASGLDELRSDGMLDRVRRLGTR